MHSALSVLHTILNTVKYSSVEPLIDCKWQVWFNEKTYICWFTPYCFTIEIHKELANFSDNHSQM